jgi:hypothetical protein
MSYFRALLLLSICGIICGFGLRAMAPHRAVIDCKVHFKQPQKVSLSVTKLAGRPGSDRRYVGEEIAFNSFQSWLKGIIRKIRLFFRSLMSKFFKIPKTALFAAQSPVLNAAKVDDIAKQQKASEKIISDAQQKPKKTDEDDAFALKFAKANAAAEASLEKERQAAMTLAKSLKMSPKEKQDEADWKEKLLKANAAADLSLMREREAAEEIAKIMKATFKTLGSSS